MKILFCCNSFCEPTETFIYNTTKSVSKIHNVNVLCLRRRNELKFPFSNTTSVDYEPKTSFLKSVLKHKFNYVNLKDKKLNDFILKYAIDYTPDIIHINYGDVAMRFISNFPQSWQKKPIIIHFHGYDASPKTLKNPWYLNKLKSLSTYKNIHFIFVSENMANRVANLMHTSINYSVVYYGIDTKFFFKTKSVKTTNELKFLQVSSFTGKKGHEYTIKAFKIHLSEFQNSKLILGGDGPLKEEMVDLAKALGIQDSVIFLGLLNKKEIKRYMVDADVFVHHSITSNEGDMEGIPNVLMEAMLMELPILSTYHSGIPELVENDINGYLTEEKNINNLAFNMKKISSWPKSLNLNREKVIEKFSLEKHLDALQEVYDKCFNIYT